MSTDTTHRNDVDDDIESAANEQTALLSGSSHHEPRTSYSFWKILRSTEMGRTVTAACGFFLALLVLVGIIGPFDIQDQLSSVPQISLSSFAVDQLTDDGLNIFVGGQITADYTHINGTLRRGLIRTLGGWLRGVEVKNSTLDIYFQDEDWSKSDENDTENDPKRTVQASIPPMRVDIRSGHNTTFNIVTTLSHFGSSDVIESIVDRLIHSKEVEFIGLANITVGKFGLFVGPIPVSIDGAINRPGDDDDDEKEDRLAYNITDINISSKEKNSLDVDMSVVLPNYFDISGSLPSLSWSIGIEGCEHEQINFANGTSKDIDMKSGSPIEVGVDVHMSQLSSELISKCSPDGNSPFSNFVQNVLKGVSNAVSITSRENRSKLPNWVTDIIDTLEVRLNVSNPKQNEDIITDIHFDEVRLDFPEAGNPFIKPADPRLSAIISAKAAVPKGINISKQVSVSMTDARGNCTILSDSKPFADVQLNDWIPCVTRQDPETSNTYIIEFVLHDVPVDITDRQVFSSVMKHAVMTGQAPIRIEAIADGKIQSPIGSFILVNVPAQGDAVLRP